MIGIMIMMDGKTQYAIHHNHNPNHYLNQPTIHNLRQCSLSGVGGIKGN